MKTINITLTEQGNLDVKVGEGLGAGLAVRLLANAIDLIVTGSEKEGEQEKEAEVVEGEIVEE